MIMLCSSSVNDAGPGYCLAITLHLFAPASPHPQASDDVVPCTRHSQRSRVATPPHVVATSRFPSHVSGDHESTSSSWTNPPSPQRRGFDPAQPKQHHLDIISLSTPGLTVFGSSFPGM